MAAREHLIPDSSFEKSERTPDKPGVSLKSVLFKPESCSACFSSFMAVCNKDHHFPSSARRAKVESQKMTVKNSRPSCAQDR